MEPAGANPTIIDMIRRFGGSTSPAMQWPEEDQLGDDEDDRFERMEKLIEKAMKRMTTANSTGSSKRQGSALDSNGGPESSNSQPYSAHEDGSSR